MFPISIIPDKVSTPRRKKRTPPKEEDVAAPVVNIDVVEDVVAKEDVVEDCNDVEEEGNPELIVVDIGSNLKQLRTMCVERNLPVLGKKSELVERINDYEKRSNATV